MLQIFRKLFLEPKKTSISDCSLFQYFRKLFVEPKKTSISDKSERFYKKFFNHFWAKNAKKTLEYLGSGTVNQENIAGTTKNKGSQESCWGSKKSFSKSGRGPFRGSQIWKNLFLEPQQPFLGDRNFSWWRQFFLIYLFWNQCSKVFSRFWPISHD